jgi:Icc protein
MKNILRLSALAFVLGLNACAPKSQSLNTPGNQASQNKAPQPVLHIAFLGDMEPKPEAKFPGTAQAVQSIHKLHADHAFDFVVSVGDVAHKGTEVQYQAATEVLRNLKLPLYSIMGNEEYGSTPERFLHYANQWGSVKNHISQIKYVIDKDSLSFIFASPDHGRELDSNGIQWILNQMAQRPKQAVFLIVHGAQVGVYPEAPEKGIANPMIQQVIAQPQLAAVISGDLHMDMPRVQHSKQIGHVHYLHIPALERTKVPDASQHRALFRTLSLTSDCQGLVKTYTADSTQSLPAMDYAFSFAGRGGLCQ